ncbi:MAG: acyl-homoserine-lactone synthase [Pseudomonadota bacterium]
MITIIHGKREAAHAELLDSMFADRKTLFVDLLGWDIPSHDGRHEVDEFDHDGTVYIVATDGKSAHQGSLRLLPTVRSHLLDTHFASLCAGGAPADAATYEVTRLCLPSRLGAKRRLLVRNELIAAMVDHALAAGIKRLVGVTNVGFRKEILAMGWLAEPLGPEGQLSGARLGAFALHIGPDTPERLSWSGIYPVERLANPVRTRTAGARS